MKRIDELTEKLNAATKAYELGQQLITDREYDELYDELLELENKTGYVRDDSPTKNVGHVVLDSLEKVEHERPMLSLDKTKEVGKLKEFLDDNEGLLSWKLDGLTVVVTYRNGSLFRVLTRGNGLIGEDITHNGRFFKNLPKKISYENELTVRAEAVISYADFERINEQYEEKYKNPRNLCSGTVRQLDSKVAARRNINAFVFSMVTGLNFSQKSEELEWLKSLGFGVVEYEKATAENIEELVNTFKEKIPDNAYGSDGLVLTYNDKSYSQSLGTTSKFPKDSIAFKWRDELAQTTLKAIEFNTSRTGLINPVAVFEPVFLEGTTVNRASLHNISILEELELGIGDEINIYKANMIIPQVYENLTKSNSFVLPDKCPACGGEAELRDNNGVKLLYCTNSDCKAKLVRAFTHFCSRDAANIENLSEATLERFVNEGFISEFADIYKLSEHRDSIIELEGFGERSYERLMTGIEASKSMPLFRLIYALGIEHVGLSNAKLLCRYSLDEIKVADKELLCGIEGFGEIIATTVYDYFHNEKNLARLDELLKYVHPAETAQNSQKKGSCLDNLTFVITGSLNSYKNRNELQEYIESLGGKVSGSVSKNTNYLINNDNTSTSSKNQKAHSLGVKIITEEEFQTMFS